MLKYKLGMNGDASIVQSQKSAVLSIPVDSILVSKGVTYVEVKEGNEVVRREVEAGIEDEDYIEIVSGLSETDEVVVPGE